MRTHLPRHGGHANARVASRRATAGLGLALAVGAGACGNGDDTSSPTSPAGVDAGKDAAAAADATVRPGDAASSPGDAADLEASAPSMVLLRVANWSADAPAVDFCLAPHGSSAFHGPLLAQLAATLTDGGASGGNGALPFPGTSSYLTMPPAQYDARVVVAGAADCSLKIVDDTNLPTVPAGGAETIALMGRAHPSTLTVRGFLDDASAPSATKPTSIMDGAAASGAGVDAALRDGAAMHAAIAPTLSPGTLALRLINASPDLSSAALTINGSPVLVDASFGSLGVPLPAREVMAEAAAPAAVDPQGYATLSALSNATFTVRSTSSTNASPSSASAKGISIADGALVTMVVVGTGDATNVNDSGVPESRLVECIDNGVTLMVEGSCSVVSMVNPGP